MRGSQNAPKQAFLEYLPWCLEAKSMLLSAAGQVAVGKIPEYSVSASEALTMGAPSDENK